MPPLHEQLTNAAHQLGADMHSLRALSAPVRSRMGSLVMFLLDAADEARALAERARPQPQPVSKWHRLFGIANMRRVPAADFVSRLADDIETLAHIRAAPSRSDLRDWTVALRQVAEQMRREVVS